MSEKLNYIKQTFKNYLKEFKQGTKKMFKEFFNKETNKKQRANMWTFMRLIIPVITLVCSVWAFILSSPVLLITSGLITGFGAVTDYFDGKSSRKHNSSSPYGKLLDQISDKIFAGVIGINLLFLNINYIYILLGELLISAVNIGYKLNYNNLNISSTKTGKIKEWPLFITLALGFFSPINPTLFSISNISIAITTLFQALTVTSYIDNNNKEIKKIKKQEIFNMLETITNEEKSDSKYQTKSIKQTNSKLDEYKNLKEVLQQIINLKEKEYNIELKSYQKNKEL